MNAFLYSFVLDFFFQNEFNKGKRSTGLQTMIDVAFARGDFKNP
jgi:hypothetical protein